jgi:tetratricopeptide (TPR) repeat protein
MVLLLMILVATLFPIRFHLWGDGALRLRNLEAGIAVDRSGALEPGDTLLHQLIVDLSGVSPEASFRITGLLAGAVYMLSVLLLIRSGPENGKAAQGWRVLAWSSPAWMVFFTGYVESYSLYLAFASLTIVLIISNRYSSLLAAASLMICCFFHLIGLLLLPAVLLRWWKGRPGKEGGAGRAASSVLVPFLLTFLLATAGIWLLLTGALEGLLPGAGTATHSGEPSNSIVASPLYSLEQALSTLLHTAPLVLLLLPFGIRRESLRSMLRSPLFPSLLLSVLLLLLWRPARGYWRDWDLMSVLLLPLFALLVASGSFRRPLSRLAVAAALLVGGARVGAFHSERTSLARYISALEAEPSAAAFEELAIYRRDRGEMGEASAFFIKAWEFSGNGRYLAQASEVERALGHHAEALDLARRAVLSRPELHVARQQLLYAAAEAGLAEEAFHAAEAACSLGGPDPMIWGKALETAVISGATGIAMEAGTEALRCGGDSVPEILTNMGVLHYQIGSYDEACSYFESAFSLDPGDPLPIFNQGCLMMELGDSSGADSLFSLCLEVGVGEERGYPPAARNLEVLRGD